MFLSRAANLLQLAGEQGDSGMGGGLEAVESIGAGGRDLVLGQDAHQGDAVGGEFVEHFGVGGTAVEQAQVLRVRVSTSLQAVFWPNRQDAGMSELHPPILGKFSR